MKQKAFDKFKPLVYALVLSLATGILIFTELFSMYGNNIDDFWFDVSVLLKPALLLAAVPTLIVFVLMAILFVVFRKKGKRPIYFVLLAIADAFFVSCYAHANFLAGMLPPLDGTEFDWSGLVPNIVSVVVVIVLAVGVVLLIKRFRSEKTAKILNFVNLAIIAMLLISFVTTIATTHVLEPKEITTVSSTKNLNLASTKKNYFVLMVDAVDAKTFEDVLSDSDADTDELKDFSYFPDSLSGYPFTRDSIPFILSGIWNENEKDFAEYSTEAFDNSKFFTELSKQDYGVKNFYDNDFVWRSRKAFEFDNIESLEKTINLRHFVTQELKYCLFKILPFPLKRLSKIDQMDFVASRVETDYTSFIWDDKDFYHGNLKQSAEKTDEKVFSYIHLEGAHVPLNLNKEVEVVDGGTDYRTKVDATLTVMKGFINYLKKNGVYDNSIIVILADHGYNAEGGVAGRQNPLLMVRQAGETHSKMRTSKKQVSFEDLNDMFIDLLNGKDSTEIFADIPEEGRERRYIYYVFNYEDHMIEQTLKGKAWETEKLAPTGKEYNR